MVTIKLPLSDQNYELTISQRYFLIWLCSAHFVLIFNKLLIWFNCKTTLWEKIIFSFLLQKTNGVSFTWGGGYLLNCVEMIRIISNLFLPLEFPIPWSCPTFTYYESLVILRYGLPNLCYRVNYRPSRIYILLFTI